MRRSIVQRNDIVRRLRLLQAELGRDAQGMADLAGISRTNWYNWIAENPKIPQMPQPEGLARLVESLPGMTLDYLYTGKLETLRGDVMIRVIARERGLDPESPDLDPATVMATARFGRPREPASMHDTYERLRARFAPLGGVDLELPPREGGRDLPDFG
jgi:hypothetical protein